MKRIVNLVSLLLLMMLVCTGCTISGTSGSGVKYLIIGGGSTAYDQQLADAIKEKLEAEGRNVSEYLPEEGTAEGQISLLTKLREKKYDCLIISPNANSVYLEGVSPYVEDGCKIVSYDQILEGDDSNCMQVCYYPTHTVGSCFLRVISQKMENESVQIAFLSPTSFSYNDQNYFRIIRRALEAGLYQNVRLTEVDYTDDDETECRDKVDHLLEIYPNLNVICATSVQTTEYTVKYLTELGKSDTVKVIGFSCSDDSWTEDEACLYTLNKDIDQMAEATAYIASAITEENFLPTEGTEISIPGVGEYTFAYNQLWSSSGSDSSPTINLNKVPD